MTPTGTAASILARHEGVRRRLAVRLRIFPLLIALAPFGCSAAPAARALAPLARPRSATPDEVREAYDGYCRGLASLSVSGDLDVRDTRTGKTQKLGVRMVVARGGRLYLKGSVAIVTALEVIDNGDRFWFQVPSKKTVWTGRSDQSPDGERDDAPYFALRPRDIVLAFLPEPLEPRDGESLLFESDRQVFSMTLAATASGAGYARRRVSLVRESLAWERSREFDEHGELQSEISVAAFQDGLPRQVVINRPAQGYVASFALDKIEKNGSVPERAFLGRAPEGYKVIDVP